MNRLPDHLRRELGRGQCEPDTWRIVFDALPAEITSSTNLQWRANIKSHPTGTVRGAGFHALPPLVIRLPPHPCGKHEKVVVRRLQLGNMRAEGFGEWTEIYRTEGEEDGIGSKTETT